MPLLTPSPQPTSHECPSSPPLPHSPLPLSQVLLALLVRGYDLQLLSRPEYVPWNNVPTFVPDKRWPLWARLAPVGPGAN